MAEDCLQTCILDFIEVIHGCYSDTNFANDRSVYAQDLAVAVGWMVALKKGVDPGKIIEKIRSSETDKCFGDYWRSGVWGEKELRALKELQAQVLKYAVKRL